MRFDRSSDPFPLPAKVAIARGQLLVNGPVQAIMLLGFGAAYFLFSWKVWAGAAVAVAGFALAWLWWSYFIPEWRAWALAKGADPEELDFLGIQSKLTWPKGSLFERTEIRRNGR
jgi:hypothetical protein